MAKTNWKATALGALDKFMSIEAGVDKAVRATLDGLEVVGVAMDVYATKQNELIVELRKARTVLDAALDTAQVVSRREFGQESEPETRSARSARMTDEPLDEL